MPTPFASVMLRAPERRMDVLTASEIYSVNARSKRVRKYNEVIEQESAYEILTKKIAESEQAAVEKEMQQPQKTSSSMSTTMGSATKSVLKVATSATFIRGIFGVMNKLIKRK